MHKLLCLSLWVGLGVAVATCARAETEAEVLQCAKAANFLAAPDSPAERHYAADREVQVLHLALDITPDFAKRTVQAQAVIRLQPLAKPVRQVRFDAVELDIHSVTANLPLQAWEVTGEQVVVTFAQPVSPECPIELRFAYSAEPQEGLYFRTPEMGYKAGDAHLFTQGEAITARHWYPCLDSPNQRFTSEITCRVPEGMTVVSNGRLVEQAKDAGTGLVAFHWVQDKPHVSYLVSLVAGYLQRVEDKAGATPLAFYTPASQIAEAPNSFRGTREMLTFFEQEIGVPYPWDKYDQVCVNDFVAGGMENTSASTLTDATLFTSASENLRTSESLVAHEMAHQWFGDLVTCKDWSQVWLNEGFATYYETLCLGQRHGLDAMRYELYLRARSLTTRANDTEPIVRRSFGQPREMFGYLTYPKAGWVLHMLRSQLGTDLYRACIKTYLQEHRFGSVTTEDLRQVLERLSGRSYDQFFDQWLYHAHHPELEISYDWDETAKLAKVSVRQVQELGPNVLLFRFPLTLRFRGKFGATDSVVQVSKNQEDFYVPLASAPEVVRVDPDYTLLAKISFEVPTPMLYAQLADRQDMVGRLLAIEELSGKQGRESVDKLQEVLNQDPFYGVRMEAAKALRGIHSPEALDALLASSNQPDARVRREVVEAVGGFYRPKACDFALQVVAKETNPDIVAVAAESLGGYARAEVDPTLVKLLATPSYRNELADAAIAGLRLQDTPSAVEPLMDALSRRDADFTSRGVAAGLETLAYLARNEEAAQKERVREFLVARVNDPRRLVQLASLRALGTLGDPKAIAVLQKFATGTKDSPQHAAAERSLVDLRAGRKPVDDFKNLRQEVLELQKANREQQEELNELKKKVEAYGQLPVAAAREVASPKPKLQSPRQQ